jgi:hypothetical protein
MRFRADLAYLWKLPTHATWDVEQAELLDAVFSADLAAFAGQSPTVAKRYEAS